MYNLISDFRPNHTQCLDAQPVASQRVGCTCGPTASWCGSTASWCAWSAPLVANHARGAPRALGCDVMLEALVNARSIDLFAIYAYLAAHLTSLGAAPVVAVASRGVGGAEKH